MPERLHDTAADSARASRPFAKSPELFVLGVSQRSAEACTREQIHVDLESIYEGLHWLRGASSVVRAGVPLSTCERTEIYGLSPDPTRARAVLLRLAAERAGVDAAVYERSAYLFEGEEAARHLFRVAAGLDSVIHGEAQILGQVRAALLHPGTDRVAGTFVKRLFQSALAAGKRVRAETEIGRGSASIAGAALCLLEARIRGLEGRSALVLGAGETGALIAKLLRKHGIRRLMIANRTVSRAQDLASELKAEAFGLDGIPDLLGQADVVVGAIGGRQDLVTEDMLKGAPPAPAGRRFLLDLAHPRNFSPDLADVPGIELVGLTRVFEEVEQARKARAAEVPRAEAIVDAEVENFLQWTRSRTSAPILRAVREQVLELAQAEAERRARGRSPEDREEFHRLARSIARTLLHAPTLAIRDADPSTPEGQWVLEKLPALLGVEGSSRR